MTSLKVSVMDGPSGVGIGDAMASKNEQYIFLSKTQKPNLTKLHSNLIDFSSHNPGGEGEGGLSMAKLTITGHHHSNGMRMICFKV